MANGIRRAAEWDVVVTQRLDGKTSGRLTENEISEVYLKRLRLAPRMTSSSFLHLLFFLQQPPGSLEAVPC